MHSELTILTLALLFDAVIGDPRWFWRFIPHPIVIFGKLLTASEWLLYSPDRSPMLSRIMGCMCVLLPITIVALATTAFQVLLGKTEYGWLAISAATGILLAHGDLWRRVNDVRWLLWRYETADKAKQSQFLDLARDGLKHLAGRRRDNLNPTQVARAAVECGAESLCDAVVAPIFWFCIGSIFSLGLPAMASYKLINTADSMMGFRNARYQHFGTFAARLDDIANWLPARISALLIAIAASLCKQYKRVAFKPCTNEAKRSASPNAGWPQAAMGLALGINLGGPIAYPGSGKNKGSKYEAIWFNQSGCDPTSIDIARCRDIGWIVWGMITISVAALAASTELFYVWK